jgi:DNA-binding response OmpR family regulator
LVIEDDEAIRRLIETTLKARGHAVKSAVDGLAGLEAARASTPDVIILDVTMPRMDGWTVLSKLRENDGFAFTPVILLTALGSPDQRADGFRLGADDYMTKPFRPAELELRVAKALKQRAQLVYFSKGLERARASASAAIRGALREFRVAAVVSLLFDERKTGLLRVASGSQQVVLKIRDGLIVSIEWDGQMVPGASKLDAMMQLKDGTFEFESAPVEGTGDVTTPNRIAALKRQ